MTFNRQRFKRYYLFLSIIVSLFILFSALLLSRTIVPHMGTASVVKAKVHWETIDGKEEGGYIIVYS